MPDKSGLKFNDIESPHALIWNTKSASWHVWRFKVRSAIYRCQISSCEILWQCHRQERQITERKRKMIKNQQNKKPASNQLQRQSFLDSTIAQIYKISKSASTPAPESNLRKRRLSRPRDKRKLWSSKKLGMIKLIIKGIDKNTQRSNNLQRKGAPIHNIQHGSCTAN